MNKEIKTQYKYNLVVGQHIVNFLGSRLARFEVIRVIDTYNYEIKFLGFDIEDVYDE